jgi:hypothetical protein
MASPGMSETRFVWTGDCFEGEIIVTADCDLAAGATSNKTETTSATAAELHIFTSETLIFIFHLSFFSSAIFKGAEFSEMMPALSTQCCYRVAFPHDLWAAKLSRTCKINVSQLSTIRTVATAIEPAWLEGQQETCPHRPEGRGTVRPLQNRLCSGTCRGRPFFGRAVLSPAENQTKSLRFFKNFKNFKNSCKSEVEHYM